jgi:RNA polymerase sigma-70 factor (ECF subfamily)
MATSDTASAGASSAQRCGSLTTPAADVIDALFRREGGKVRAALVRRFGDLALAEDMLQEAYLKALSLWPRTGVPDNPAAWLSTVARNHGLDIVRRNAHQLPDAEQVLELLEAAPVPDAEDNFIEDDRLRLIFVCCHPALGAKAQAMLALRSLCGLSTREIARAYLETESGAAQRMVRAQKKISEAKIAFEIPAPAQLAERLALVLEVVYLVFNEGYGATSGPALLRPDLGAEAIRLGRMLAELMPAQAEVHGLLALMLLQHARRDARVDRDGALTPLERQNRSSWHAAEVAEGQARLDLALAFGAPGPYQIQAAIAALHAGATRAEDTDWPQIADLYVALLRYWPTPVVALNAAVARGMADGPAHGLALIDAIAARGELARSHYLPAARADLLRRLGRNAAAKDALDQALALVSNDVERAFLQKQRDSLNA